MGGGKAEGKFEEVKHALSVRKAMKRRTSAKDSDFKKIGTLEVPKL
jgi:hypothetical protein